MNEFLLRSVTTAVRSFFEMFEGKAVAIELSAGSFGRPLDKAFELQAASFHNASGEVRLDFIRDESLTFSPVDYRHFFSIEQRTVGIEIDAASARMQSGEQCRRFGAGAIRIFVMPSDHDRAPGETFDYARWLTSFGGIVTDVLNTALAQNS